MLADRGTNYFHSLVKRRNSSNSIPSLIKQDGSSTTSQEEVIDELLSFYRDLLCIDKPVQSISTEIIQQGLVLNSEECSKLTGPIDDDTIKDALFHIGDDKAHGPDGFTAAIFKSNWDTIKVEFLQAIHVFFSKGRLLKQFNHAAIALIPKTKHAPRAKDFRPISCCNVIYKTIAKVIANRLAAVIPGIIDPAQNAFLEERLMLDNILLAQQLVRRYGKSS